MSLIVKALTGADLQAALDDVAQLRITVFRTWPYLYDGDLDYERNYMKAYQSPQAVVVAAIDAGKIVGVANGSPMLDHAEDFSAAFAARPEPVPEIFYFAESVLLPAYRGAGVGHKFFDLREAHARSCGARFAAFCSVVRPDDHPLRPDNYQPLDPFWRKRGYAPLDDVAARFRWKDINETHDTEKTMQFWMKPL